MKLEKMDFEGKQECGVGNKRVEKIEHEESRNAEKCDAEEEIGDPQGRRICAEVSETERGE